MKAQAKTKASENMKELYKIIDIDELYDDAEVHPHAERKKLIDCLISYKVSIRRLYLKYSMILVSAPDKVPPPPAALTPFSGLIIFPSCIQAFQMSRPQFIRFVKDAGILGKGKVDSAFVDEVFMVANMPVVNGVTQLSGIKKVDPKNPINVMMMDEFVEAMVRLADRLLRDQDVAPAHKRVQMIFDEYLIPISETDFDISEPECPGLGVEGSDTNKIIEANYKRIEAAFKHYGGANQDGPLADNGSVDCIEWMMACRDCQIIDANLSFSKVLEIFVRCNQDELEDYFYGMPNPMEIRDMNLELEEFLQVIIIA